MVDNRLCSIEVIDTAATGKVAFVLLLSSAYLFIDIGAYSDLRDQSIRSVVVDLFLYPPILFFLIWIFSAGQGFILVYSIASRYSFEHLEVTYQSMRSLKQGELIFMLVGTKCDMKAHEREVLKREGAALARQYGCEFIETSAKTTQNVDRLFINLVRSLRQTGSTEQEPAKKGRKPCKCVIM